MTWFTDEEGREKPLGGLGIAALTEELPMGFIHHIGGLIVIVSEQNMDQLIENNSDLNARIDFYLDSADPIKTQHQIEDIIEGDMYVFNVYQMRRQEEQMLLIMSVFTYGFIVLITAISIANIFNTISTGISLRKREFAMLKSVGMTPKSFNRMINYESFLRIKSLLYASH